jgi:hypothetical protein
VLEFPPPASSSSLPSSLQCLFASLAVLCNVIYPSGSSRRQVQLQLYFRIDRLQLSSPIFKFNCKLYFSTSQATIVLYHFSSSTVTIFPDHSVYNCFLCFVFEFNCLPILSFICLSSFIYKAKAFHCQLV